MHYALGFIFNSNSNNSTQHTLKYLVISLHLTTSHSALYFLNSFPTAIIDDAFVLGRADQWTETDSVSESYCLSSQPSQMPVVSAKLGSSFCLSAKKCDLHSTSDTLMSTGYRIPFLREDKCSSICLWCLVIKKNCTWDLNVPTEGIFACMCIAICLQKPEDTVWLALPCPIMLHFHFVCLEFTR